MPVTTFRSALAFAALAAATAGIAVYAAAGAAPLRPDLTAKDRARIAGIVRPATDFSAPERFETNQGGATTTRRFDRDAFSQPAANLEFADRARFSVGNGIFRKLWVSAPSSTTGSDGLGPLFNARGCQECHLKDGRGHPPAPGDPVSFVYFLSAPATDGPEPAYGGQIQDFAAPGLVAEGHPAVTYEERPVKLNGGTASLRVPHYRVDDLAHGPLPEGTLTSPRVAPPMIGLGLLEAIHPDDLAALADPDDADGDGISGRLGRSTDGGIGRFGWKATEPSLATQSARAFFADMGLSTPAFPDGHGECTPAETRCLAAPVGAEPGGFEVPQELFDEVVFYSQHLAVPARRDVGDAQVLQGKALFYGAGCTGCHTPKFVTSNDPSVLPSLRRQLIWPYTDLLLHDMGPELADGRPQGVADGQEWRTTPLWGIGLAGTVDKRAGYLHDGRARTLLEAILWHGGEGAASRDRVVDMTPDERDALVRFLQSL